MQQQPTIIIAIMALLIVSAAASPNFSPTVNNTATTLSLPTSTPTPVPDSSSSGGSSGGGGNYLGSGENASNIAEYLRLFINLRNNIPILSVVKSKNLSVFELAVTGSASDDEVPFRVELLKGMSKFVTQTPAGQVYKYINIFSGTSKIRSAKIRFTVENLFITPNAKIELLRWVNGAWVPLGATQLKSDGTYTYYESETPGFSSFAIVNQQNQAPTSTAPSAPTAIPQTQQQAPTAQANNLPQININQTNQSNQSIFMTIGTISAAVPSTVWYLLAIVLITGILRYISRKKQPQIEKKSLITKLKEGIQSLIPKRNTIKSSKITLNLNATKPQTAPPKSRLTILKERIVAIIPAIKKPDNGKYTIHSTTIKTGEQTPTLKERIVSLLPKRKTTTSTKFMIDKNKIKDLL